MSSQDIRFGAISWSTLRTTVLTYQVLLVVTNKTKQTVNDIVRTDNYCSHNDVKVASSVSTKKGIKAIITYINDGFNKQEENKNRDSC